MRKEPEPGTTGTREVQCQSCDERTIIQIRSVKYPNLDLNQVQEKGWLVEGELLTCPKCLGTEVIPDEAENEEATKTEDGSLPPPILVPLTTDERNSLRVGNRAPERIRNAKRDDVT